MDVSIYNKLVDCIVQTRYSYTNFSVLPAFKKSVSKPTVNMCFPFFLQFCQNVVFEPMLLGTYFFQDYYIFLMNFLYHCDDIFFVPSTAF